MESQQQGKQLPMERGVTRDRSQVSIPMQRKERLVLTSVGIRECLTYGLPVGCVSLVFVLLTQMYNPMMGDTHTKSCLSTSGEKRGNVLGRALSDGATSRHLCYQWTG